MESHAARSAHRCNLCAKTYSRRENLARHHRAAHERQTAQYACSLCSSRFARSDLLFRHRKIHDNDSTTSMTASGRAWRRRKPHGRATDADEDMSVGSPQHATVMQDTGAQDAARPGLLTSDLTPQTQTTAASSSSFINSEQVLEDALTHPRSSSNHDDAPDCYMQWPFYGETLQDANIDWTLDFFSNDILTGTPLGSDYDDLVQTIAVDETGIHHNHGVCQPSTRNDDPPSQPRAWADRGPASGTLQSDRLSHVVPESAAYVDAGEYCTFIETAGPLPLSFQLLETSHTLMKDTATATLLHGFCSDKGKRPHSFPTCSTVNYFLHLFLIHVHPRFPVLHLPTFDPNCSSPNLLLAMAIMGSSYSESNQGRFALAYIDRTRLSIKLMQEKDQTYLRSVDTLFAFFLVSLSAMWIGHKPTYERGEGDRGELALHCRRNQLWDCRTRYPSASQSAVNPHRGRLEETWMGWVHDEQRKRLGLCVYLLDCQMAAFFQRQPYISKAETVNIALPCSQTFWNAPAARAWKALLGPADIPPSIYFLTTLNTILLHGELSDVLPFPPLDDFCKTFFAYVLHTHVFEWRQTVCMLNPTGLLTSPVSMAPQNIGKSLHERSEWLESCLTNWSVFYGDQNQADPTDRSPKNSSGMLLYHLAILALHLNFSDLHNVAGRSGSDVDVELAEQSLCNWLQGERAQKVFDTSCEMLKVARDALAAGDMQRSSFELSICLFMGGLASWAMSRFIDFESTTLVSRPLQIAGNEGNPDPRTEQAAQTRDFLLAQVTGARNDLRALRCLRIAVALADSLDRLLSEPVR